VVVVGAQVSASVTSWFAAFVVGVVVAVVVSVVVIAVVVTVVVTVVGVAVGIAVEAAVVAVAIAVAVAVSGESRTDKRGGQSEDEPDNKCGSAELLANAGHGENSPTHTLTRRRARFLTPCVAPKRFMVLLRLPPFMPRSALPNQVWTLLCRPKMRV